MQLAKREKKSEGFEGSLALLEKLADELESGELKLEDAIRKYEEGVKLYGKCQEILGKAARKVEMLTADAEGKLKPVPFERSGVSEESDEGDGDEETSEEGGELF